MPTFVDQRSTTQRSPRRAVRGLRAAAQAFVAIIALSGSIRCTRGPESGAFRNEDPRRTVANAAGSATAGIGSPLVDGRPFDPGAVTALYYDEQNDLLFVEDTVVRAARAVNLVHVLIDPELPPLERLGDVRTEVDLGERIKQIFHGSPYSAIVAFPDGWRYQDRLAAMHSWAPGASHGRISGAAQMAALGDSNYRYFPPADRRLVYFIAGPRDASVAVAEWGGHVTQIIASDGARQDSPGGDVFTALARRMIGPAAPPTEAVVSGAGLRDDLVATLGRQWRDVPVSFQKDLVAKGLLTQVGIFRGMVKDNLLLVTWPHTAVGAVELSGANGRRSGDAIPRPPGLITLLRAGSTIPIQMSGRLDVGGAGGEVWLVEVTPEKVTLLAQIPRPPSDRGSALEITLDVDADMSVEVSVPAIWTKPRPLGDLVVR